MQRRCALCTPAREIELQRFVQSADTQEAIDFKSRGTKHETQIRCRLSSRSGREWFGRHSARRVVEVPPAAAHRATSIRFRIFASVAGIVGISLILAARPLPHIAGHVNQTIWAVTLWRVFPDRHGVADIEVEIGQIRRRGRITPWKNSPIRASASLFPLCLSRQTAASPLAYRSHGASSHSSPGARRTQGHSREYCSVRCMHLLYTPFVLPVRHFRTHDPETVHVDSRSWLFVALRHRVTLH